MALKFLDVVYFGVDGLVMKSAYPRYVNDGTISLIDFFYFYFYFTLSEKCARKTGKVTYT